MSVLTPPGLLSFPALFAPKPRAQGGDPVYSAVLIFDEAAMKSPAWQKLRVEVMDAIDDKWPGKAKDEKFVKSLHLPFRDGAEKEYDGYGPGKKFITPWTKNRPGVVNVNREDINDPADVFSGQLARFSVSAFAWENTGKRGVSFALEHVQILKEDMPRMDGRKSAKQAFDDDLSGSAPTQDDEIPF